jgi:RimJ/RimL family protein N-acetyltransferase
MKRKSSQRSLSLGIRTEMIFHRFDGVVLDRGTYLIVKTPSNPGFFFGNFALFFEAPKPGSLGRWKTVFRKEFEDCPAVEHVAFVWDAPSEGIGDISELEAENFKVNFSLVLTTRSVRAPPKPNSGIEVRPIASDAEWKDVVEGQIRSKAAGFEETAYRQFKELQMARYRAMSENGLGYWFGAFLHGKLVGDLGLYKDGTVGRFQAVETDPEFRRQGVCGTLVHASAQYGFQTMGLSDLVMVADERSQAAKIYGSVGFAPAAKDYSAYWWDKGPGGSPLRS